MYFSAAASIARKAGSSAACGVRLGYGISIEVE